MLITEQQLKTCPLVEIKTLKDNESYLWPLSDYGLAEIWFKNDSYFLFEIPEFGGTPSFVEAYPAFRLGDLIKKIESWS